MVLAHVVDPKNLDRHARGRGRNVVLEQVRPLGVPTGFVSHFCLKLAVVCATIRPDGHFDYFRIRAIGCVFAARSVLTEMANFYSCSYLIIASFAIYAASKLRAEAITASRMKSHGAIGEIQVTESTYDALKNDFVFGDCRIVSVKGKGELKTWYLLGRRAN